MSTTAALRNTSRAYADIPEAPSEPRVVMADPHTPFTWLVRLWARLTRSPRLVYKVARQEQAMHRALVRLDETRAQYHEQRATAHRASDCLNDIADLCADALGANESTDQLIRAVLDEIRQFRDGK